MDILKEFFKNPNWISAIVVVAYFAYKLIDNAITTGKQRIEKKIKAEKEKSDAEKKEKSYKALDRLSDAVELLVQKETNQVNLMAAENIITNTLNASKAVIKEEIRRIFKHNHRENAQRQQIIKNAIRIVTLTAFENDIKTLSTIYYKNTKLANFLLNIDTDDFYKNLLKLLFSTNGNVADELRDVIYFLDSSFETFILTGKKYYSNIN